MSGLTTGQAGRGLLREGIDSVRQQAHDGDTATVRAEGTFWGSLLGVDAPEISFTLPPEDRFAQLSDARWERLLSDPYADSLPPFDPPPDPGLFDDLRGRTGPGVATNHHEHSAAAEDAFEAEVLGGMEALGRGKRRSGSSLASPTRS